MYAYTPYDATIKDHQLEIRPFLFQMYITGRLEVVTPLEIPPQSLFTKIHLPNQIIKDVEMIPDRREQCISEYGKCNVFKFKTFFSLSGDKYYSRSFPEYEKIPLKMFFELKESNWSFLKDINGLRDSHDFRYINFINRLKHLELNCHFHYKNTFTVERTKYESSWKWVDVPMMWKINRYSSEVVTWRLGLSIKKLDFLREPIGELFSISAPEDIEIEARETLLTLPNRLEIKLAPPRQIRAEGRLIFRVSEGITRTPNGSYGPDPLSDRIFIHEKTRGLIGNRLLVKRLNNSFYLNINNHYSFDEERNPHIPKNSRIMVVKKEEDGHFHRLNMFNYIDF